MRNVDTGWYNEHIDHVPAIMTGKRLGGLQPAIPRINLYVVGIF